MSATFADLGVPGDLVTALARLGITEPFPVQAATIADGLAGRDVCGRAPTGSGKTLAFGVPLVARVESGRPRRPRALVLAPTRELAQQIHQELEPLARVRGRRLLTVHGGVGYGHQRQTLRKGVDVLVACPGRLEDLIGEGSVDLADVDHVVVDEADRMADMGFLPSVRRLLDATRNDRQTVLFSATLDGDVAVLTRRYQHDPVRHEVGDVEPDVTAAHHVFWQVDHQDRRRHTARAIADGGPTVVFCRTRRGADRLARVLDRDGIPVAAIHGGRSQGQRDRALAAFAAGRARALIATDVAARGIHVDGVACVVHFDPPEDAKAYLHRSGRTARAGATGTVVSLVRPDDAKATRALQRELGLDQQLSDPGALAPTPPAEGRHHTPERHHTGTVQFFDTRRGFGFIAVPGRDDLFVHHSHLGERKCLDRGQQVRFEIGAGRKGDEARRVEVVTAT